MFAVGVLYYYYYYYGVCESNFPVRWALVAVDFTTVSRQIGIDIRKVCRSAISLAVLPPATLRHYRGGRHELVLPGRSHGSVE
jgi:hypothetical protein